MIAINHFKRRCPHCGFVESTNYTYLTAESISNIGVWADKPAPYCLLQNHVPQIRVDEDFHEWFSDFKLRVKDGVE